MDKHYSAEIPQMAVNTRPKMTLNYGVYEVGEDEMLRLWQQQMQEEQSDTPDEWFVREHKYAYYQVLVPLGRWNKDGLVDAIIRDKYSVDAMEAITNNMASVTSGFFEALTTNGIIAATKYLLETIDEDRTERFNEMQAWRTMAKETAAKIIG